ncbi:late histone H2B.L4-like [Sorex fumeus]|uniref:late histone H2B.L4-like n=1 Tax=Sorex fumeus TaxID=62283 RepID=UPI0024AD5D90|nr:late histone H2B.L4-like [Sorex fumeus]
MDQLVPEIVSEEPTLKEEDPAEAEQEAAKPKTQKRCRRRRQPRYSPSGLSCRRTYESFAIYFPRVLKTVQEGMSLSKQALCVLDSFVEDIFERIVREAAKLTQASNRVTITCQELQAAVRMLLPRELARNAEKEGTKAVLRYTENR